MHAILGEIADLVSTPEFKQSQDDFHAKFCGEFEAGDSSTENKLAYTAIHNQYVAQVEGAIAAHIGNDKLVTVMSGLEAYLKAEAHAKTEEVARTLDILESMADFEAFKTSMLHKREAVASGGGAGFGSLAVVDLGVALEKCAELVEAANASDGWKLVCDTPEITGWTSPGRDKDTLMRCCMSIDMPPEQCGEMMCNFSPESIAWRETMSSLELLQDYGPSDKVVKMGLKVPWLLRYMMSIPDEMAMRIVYRTDYPNPGDTSYVVVPFDVEKQVALESVGPMKIKSGVISPHPDSPGKTMLRSLDSANLSMMPDWGLGMLLKSHVSKQIGSMQRLFKASEYCKARYP